MQGAPGFEHSFLRRAWATDRGLEVDSVARKGRDDSGAETFYVQAAQSRAGALLGGYPNTRDALFAYDVIVLANVEPDLLTSQQLAMTRAFVAERGGGLLVLGARGFQRQGLRDTPLEDVLPLEVADKNGGGIVPASVSPGRNRVALTPAGEDHPVMQLGPNAADNDKKWAAVPTLAAISPLGAAKPGASVLAVTGGPGGAARALVAVQRFGEGRSMVFTGEASWRWRMLLPSLGSVVRALLAAGGALARAERARTGHDHAAGGARSWRRRLPSPSPRATRRTRPAPTRLSTSA